MTAYLISGLTLGLAAGAQPGPFQTYIINQAILRGWKRTLIAAFAPLLSDGPIIVLVLLIISQIPEWFQSFLFLAGGIFILSLAWKAYQNWNMFSRADSEESQSGAQSLLRATMMNLLSPGPYIFWSLVLGPTVLETWKFSKPLSAGFLLCFYGAMISINISVILVFGLAKRFGKDFQKTMLLISAIALAVFGIYQLFRGLAGIFQLFSGL